MKRFIAALIVLLVAATGAAVSAHILIDRSNLREEVIAAVKRQTGRDLSVGRFSVGILPWPGFSARDVTLSNPPGESDLPMLTARDIRGSLALIPLLWREIRLENLTLVQGALALHREEGRSGNWEFHPSAAGSGALKEGSSRPTARWKLKVGSARLERMVLSLEDRTTLHSGKISVERAEFDGLASDAPYLDIHARRGDTPFRVNGHIGPLSLFEGESPRWTLSLGATLGNEGKGQDWLNFDGQIMDPRQIRGFSGVLRGELSSLKDLETVFPQANLPDLKGIGGEIGFYDADPEAAESRFDLSRLGVNHLHLHVGSVPVWRGVSVGTLRADAETLSSALTIGAVLHGTRPDLAIESHFGTLAQAGAAWQSKLASPLTVSANLNDRVQPIMTVGLKDLLAGESGSVKAALIRQDKGQEPQARRTALDHVYLTGNFSRDAAGTVQIKGLTVKSASVTGVLDGTLQEPLPSAIQGKIHFDYVDLDAVRRLWQGWGETKNGSPGAVGVKATATRAVTVKTDLMPKPDQAGETSVADSESVSSTTVPTKVTPQDFFDHAQGMIDITADKMQLGDIEYTGVSAHLTLASQRFSIDSLKGFANGTALSGQAFYDASSRPAMVSVTLSPLLIPATLAQHLLALPDLLRGPLLLVGRVEARGEKKNTLLESMTGHLGVSLAGGTVASSSLVPFLGGALWTLLPRSDLPMRCLGLHATFQQGRLLFDTIGFDTGVLSLSGNGTYALLDGALDLHLLPRVELGPMQAYTPLNVTGTLGAPVSRRAADKHNRLQVKIHDDQPFACEALLSSVSRGVEGETEPEVGGGADRVESMERSGMKH